MAAITATTGSSNWNTNGAWVGSVQPTASDDVTIPASAVITIPSATTALARSVTVQTSGTLTFAATTSILTIGDGTAGAGSVAFSNAGTITLTAIGTINFISTSATVQTVTSGGQTMPNLTFNAASNGSWQLADALVATGATLTITKGTLDLNNNAVSVGIWSCASANTILITGTQTITQTSGGQFSGGGKSYSSVTMTAAGGAANVIANANTFVNLTRTGTSAKTDGLFLAADQIVTGILTLNSFSATSRLIIQSNTVGTPRIITAAAVIISNIVDFQDITGAGAATWTVAGTGATAIGDCGGNSGITMTPAATQTATGTAGFTWSTHGWTSRVPLPQDNVVISNAFAAGQTITADMPRLGASISLVGATGTPTLNISVVTSIYGSLTLIPGMVLSGASANTFLGRGAFTLTSATQSFGATMNFNAPGGTYTLQDDLVATAAVNVNNTCTLTANNKNVTATQYTWSSAGGTAVVNMGTGTWTSTSTAAATVFSVGAVTVNPSTSTIVISGASANTRTFAGNGKTYGTLTYTVAGSTGALVVTGANTFATINFSDVTNARTLTLSASTTTTVGTFNVNGTSGKLMTVNSSTPGTTATLAQSGSHFICDYLSVQDITVTGTTQAEAGSHSTNVSNNSGWIFTVPFTNTGFFF